MVWVCRNLPYAGHSNTTEEPDGTHSPSRPEKPFQDPAKFCGGLVGPVCKWNTDFFRTVPNTFSALSKLPQHVNTGREQHQTVERNELWTLWFKTVFHYHLHLIWVNLPIKSNSNAYFTQLMYKIETNTQILKFGLWRWSQELARITLQTSPSYTGAPKS